jgi:predicted metal-dependent peptidase
MTHIRISKSHSRLITQEQFAFFGALILNLIPKAATGFRTMATDAKHLFYSETWLDDPTTTDDEVDFVNAHEAMHCALGHCSRRGDRDHERWNIACDHEDNLILKAAGVRVPDNRPCDPRFTGLYAEQIYEILLKEEQQQQPEPEDETDEDQDQQEDQDDGEAQASDDQDEGDEDSDQDQPGEGEGDPDDDGEASDGDAAGSGGAEGSGDGDGDGAGGDGPDGDREPASCGDPGGCGEVLDAATTEAGLDAAKAEWEVFTRQAVNIARKIGEGRVPGFLEEIVGKLNDPKTNWRDATRRFVDPYSSTKDYSWTQPSRRMLSQGFVVPGLISDGLHRVAMLIDASGSIDLDKLATFGGEVQAALDEGGIDQIIVIWFDTRVNAVHEYSQGDIINWTPVGRGGTDFAPAFATLNEVAPDVACAILFTDMQCTSYGPEPTYPVLFAAYGDDPQQLAYWIGQAPWGEPVEVTTY